MAIDDQGRIVVGAKFDQTPVRHVDGIPQNSTAPADQDAFVVARLVGGSNANAHELDSSFGPGGTGVVETRVGNGWNELTGITIATNGDIWASGRACSSGQTCEAYLNGEPFESILLKFTAAPQPNDPPTADPGGPYSGTEGVATTLDGSASNDPDGDSLIYTWDFGDGSIATTAGMTIDHAYASAGTYTLTLTVSDGIASSDPVTTTAVIAAAPPSNSEDIYVWDISFDQKRRGPHTDYRILGHIKNDSNADGIAGGLDSGAANVLVTVELRDQYGVLVDTLFGTTDDSGGFASEKIRGLPSGDYTAEVIDLVHGTFTWNHLLDPTPNDQDSDGDGLPDDVLTVG